MQQCRTGASGAGDSPSAAVRPPSGLDQATTWQPPVVSMPQAPHRLSKPRSDGNWHDP